MFLHSTIVIASREKIPILDAIVLSPKATPSSNGKHANEGAEHSLSPFSSVIWMLAMIDNGMRSLSARYAAKKADPKGASFASIRDHSSWVSK
jgi:hypothetical protein